MRPVYLACGVLSLGLGFAGAFLPVLPTTPFVLLSAFCFSRSHPAWHARLRSSAAFGRAVRDWEERGAISRRGKLLATSAMLAVAAALWAFGAQSPALKLLVSAVEAAVLAFIWTRPDAEAASVSARACRRSPGT